MSELYLNELSGDLAFGTIQRATAINTLTIDKFDYLLQQKKIAELASAISIKGFNKPHFETYIQQQIVIHILDIAREIIHFPNIQELFRLKNLFSSGELDVFENENFDIALSHYNLNKYKHNIVEEINQFTFNVLPIKMGLPSEFNSSDKILSLFDKKYDATVNWSEIERIKNILNRQDNRELLIALEFAESIFQKYYSKN